MKFIGIAMLAATLQGQSLDLSSLDKLAAKAKESTNINMDGEKLRLAAGLFNSSGDDQKLKQTIANIRALNVRTFEFANTGAYTLADLDPIRNQLKAPGWSRIVESKESDELTEVYLFSTADKLLGLAVLSLEKQELTVVNVSGPVDLKALEALNGNVIPKLHQSFGPGKAGTPNPPPTPRKNE